VDTFIAAWKDAVIENYGNFSGRLGVGGFWRFVAVNFVVYVVLVVLGRASSLFVIVAALYWLALLIPTIGAGIRRLHDTDRTGMWLLLSLIPCVGLVLIVFFVQPGTPSTNQYGEVPAT
jgi:uncharacterized membrane protein YhaH (DUF805 family)